MGPFDDDEFRGSPLDAVNRTAKMSQKYKVETIFPNIKCFTWLYILTNSLAGIFSKIKQIWKFVSSFWDNITVRDFDAVLLNVIRARLEAYKVFSLIRSSSALWHLSYITTKYLLWRKRFNPKILSSSLIYIFVRVWHSVLSSEKKNKRIVFLFQTIFDDKRPVEKGWQSRSM